MSSIFDSGYGSGSVALFIILLSIVSLSDLSSLSTKFTGEHVAALLGWMSPAASWSFIVCSNSFLQW